MANGKDPLASFMDFQPSAPDPSGDVLATFDQFQVAPSPAAAPVSEPDGVTTMIPTAAPVGPAAAVEEFTPEETSFLEQLGSGLNEGIFTMLGAPVDFSNWSQDLIVKGVNKATGASLKTTAEINEQLGRPALGSSEAMIQAGGDLGLISDVDPQTGPQRFARRVGQEVGAGAVAAPVALAAVPARAGAVALTDLAADIGSGTAAQAATEYFPDSVTAQLAASLAGSAAGAVGATGAIKASDRAAYKKIADRALRDTPDSGILKTAAKNLYNDAEANGLTASRDQVTQMSNDLIAIADGEGLLVNGKISADMPKVKAGYKLASELGEADSLTPAQMLKLRRNFQRIAASNDPSEARIGVQMLKSYDNFTSGLLPQLAEANRLYAAAMRGNLIETTVRKAEIDARKSRTLGFDDEIRKKFSKILKDIEDGKKGVQKLSADQKAIIERIAVGGLPENIATKIGKFAPTGAISGAASMGPAAVGTISAAASGNPLFAVGGAALTGAGIAAGAAGRAVVNKMQRRNTKIASALMRGMARPDGPKDVKSFNQVFSTWILQNAGSIAGQSGPPQGAPTEGN